MFWESFETQAARLAERAADIVWGPAMIILLLGAGVYFSVRTRFMQATRWKTIWRRTFGDLLHGRARTTGGITPFQAMSTALASTVGTGNIVGVAAALMVGGPGAIFWMWVSAFFGMMTKYAEVVLAQKYRRPDGQGGFVGGPMYVIRDGLHMPKLAGLFALLGTLASLGMGNMIQSNAIAQAATSLWPVSASAAGLLSMSVVGAVILGGMKSIARVTEKLVPVMAGIYLIGGFIVLAACWDKILPSLWLIVKDAFTVRTAAAGLGGYALSRSLRIGLARGAFSNEAGMGSGAIAHAAANARRPAEQGFWGAMEVFVDTIVICTLTALVILSTGVFDTWQGLVSGGALNVSAGLQSVRGVAAAGGDETPLVIMAFSRVMGQAGGWLVGVSTILFALASIIGWCFYGECCYTYLFARKQKRARLLFRVLYMAAVYVGATLQMGVLWNLADIFNGLMAVPNLIALFLLSGVVIAETRSYWKEEGRLG